MRSKKWMSLLLAAAMSVSLLAGCGNSSEQSSTPSTGSNASQPVQQESSSVSEEDNSSTVPATEEEPSGWSYEKVDTLENPNVTIILYWEPNAAEQAGIDAFEAKYGGKVTVNVVGWNKGATAIQEGMATGEIGDLVFTEGAARFPGDAVDELYQPMDEYIDSSVCDQASLDAFLFKGQHYVFTNNAITSPIILFYNKTIFEEEALETPAELFDKGEWTYAKFLEYMAYFTRDTDGDGEIDQWGLGPRFARQHFGFANDGMPVYEVGNGELAVGIDTPECMQWFEFLNTFGQINTKCPGDGSWLETRLCVMFSEALSYAGLDESATTDEIDFISLPTYDGRLATTPVWDNGYAIVNGAPNSEGAAVLATMICKAKLDSYQEELKARFDDKQVERFYNIMTKIIPQRRKYAGIDEKPGEPEALQGTPAQTIVETYKSQLEAEVAAYNETVK